MTKKSDQVTIYASSLRRSGAVFVDIIITTFLRIVVAEIIGRLWFNNQILTFLREFKEKFGTETVGRDEVQIAFFISHPVFKSALLFYLIILLVGAFYHCLLNSSSWMATVGKRLMRIALVKETGRKITFLEAGAHYFLSLIPWIFIVYLASYQAYNNLTIYQAVANNGFNLLLGILVLLWVEIQLITKKKTTAQDMFCNMVMVNGVFGGKFPKIKLFTK